MYEFQPSPDVVVRVREAVIRVRVRKTALRTVIRVTADNQELHGISPFREAHPLPSPRTRMGEEGCITVPHGALRRSFSVSVIRFGLAWMSFGQDVKELRKVVSYMRQFFALDFF